MFDRSRRTSRPSHSPRAGGLALGLALALTLGLATLAQTASARAPGADRLLPSTVATATHHAPIARAGEEDQTPVPRSVAIAIRNAGTALKAAQTNLHRRQYAKATSRLRALRVDVARAHRVGIAQIGRPPVDPEGDEPPGPVSVVAVLALEHRVAVGLLEPFNGLQRRGVVRALQTTLSTTFGDRDRMLNAVIKLPAEGAGADYGDGMADTLGMYTREVKLYTTASSKYRLSAAAAVAVRNGLARVRATHAKVNEAFGGGE